MTIIHRRFLLRQAVVAAACLGLTLVAATAQGQAEPAALPVKALVGATVVDLDGKAPIEDAVVLIAGERITAVGSAATVMVPVGAEVVRLDGKWLIPGLMNMHVHLGLNLPGKQFITDEPTPALALRMIENGQKTLQAGVTTVRLTGESGGVDFIVKKAIDSGRFDGPRIATVGEIIVPTGGHGTLEANGPYGFAEAVRSQIKAGATWIKLSISGGISDTHGSISAAPMTDDELKTTIEVAHRNGAKVTAHNGSPVAGAQAIAFGVDGFEHGYYLTEPILKQMKEKTVWLVPTIVVSQPGSLEFFHKIGSPDWYLERQKAVGKDHLLMLQKAIKIGVPIALGTDQFPFEPNGGTTATVREAEIYAEAGMTPLQALRSATSEPARMLGLEADIGSIAVGKYADIVAVAADPSADIRALRAISFVMKGGKIMRDDSRGIGGDPLAN